MQAPRATDKTSGGGRPGETTHRSIFWPWTFSSRGSASGSWLVRIELGAAVGSSLPPAVERDSNGDRLIPNCFLAWA